MTFWDHCNNSNKWKYLSFLPVTPTQILFKLAWLVVYSLIEIMWLFYYHSYNFLPIQIHRPWVKTVAFHVLRRKSQFLSWFKRLPMWPWPISTIISDTPPTPQLTLLFPFVTYHTKFFMLQGFCTGCAFCCSAMICLLVILQPWHEYHPFWKTLPDALQ